MPENELNLHYNRSDIVDFQYLINSNILKYLTKLSYYLNFVFDLHLYPIHPSHRSIQLSITAPLTEHENLDTFREKYLSLPSLKSIPFNIGTLRF